MDRLTKEQRHHNMSNIRSSGTSIERILCKALRAKGYGYRKNYRDLPGRPDIVLTKYRIAIFCDSEFFHGKDWEHLEDRLRTGSNPDFWISKIRRNMQRDEKNNMELRHLGWRVIRFWGNDIKKNTEKCLEDIEDMIIDYLKDQV